MDTVSVPTVFWGLPRDLGHRRIAQSLSDDLQQPASDPHDGAPIEVLPLYRCRPFGSPKGRVLAARCGPKAQRHAQTPSRERWEAVSRLSDEWNLFRGEETTYPDGWRYSPDAALE